MPLTRYQIRNEYNLADPELYRAADRDDPEALLEGVAMAGLVGVLRQLGDLAEFAAEIFHDLHEEVMSTAARGHGLMARVQQLEAEFPSVEKTFLSQTNHSLFFSSSGIDWHPILRTEQNLVTRGDLPRCILDSYEECRGPPRLFLLDKYDVAGAGSCLKRYTDPSFFKIEAASSGRATSEFPREKKYRKGKKKGSRWRIVATTEIAAKSHAKLHQLFLEERVENDYSDPARLVKLKRRHLNGFPLNLKSGRSYMEKILPTPSTEHKTLCENLTSPLSLTLTSNSSSVSELDLLEINTVSAMVKSPQEQEHASTAPDVQEVCLKPSVVKLIREEAYSETKSIPEPTNAVKTNSFPFKPHDVMDEKELINKKGKTEGSLEGIHSEDLTNELDNYMDALNTMESEMESDSEYRGKNETEFLDVEQHWTDSDANRELMVGQVQHLDSESTGNTSVTDDGTSSFKKVISSSSYSDTRSISADDSRSDGEEADKLLCSLENRVTEEVDVPSNQLPVDKEVLESNSHKHAPASGKVTDTNRNFALGDAAHGTCHSDSSPTLLALDPVAILPVVSRVASESGETSLDHAKHSSDELSTEEIGSNLDDSLVGDFYSQKATFTESPKSLSENDFGDGSASSDTFLPFSSITDNTFEEIDCGNDAGTDDANEKCLGESTNAEIASAQSIISPMEDNLQCLAGLGDSTHAAESNELGHNVKNRLLGTIVDSENISHLSSAHNIVPATREVSTVAYAIPDAKLDLENVTSEVDAYAIPDAKLDLENVTSEVDDIFPPAEQFSGDDQETPVVVRDLESVVPLGTEVDNSILATEDHYEVVNATSTAEVNLEDMTPTGNESDASISANEDFSEVEYAIPAAEFDLENAIATDTKLDDTRELTSPRADDSQICCLVDHQLSGMSHGAHQAGLDFTDIAVFNSEQITDFVEVSMAVNDPEEGILSKEDLVKGDAVPHDPDFDNKIGLDLAANDPEGGFFSEDLVEGDFPHDPDFDNQVDTEYRDSETLHKEDDDAAHAYAAGDVNNDICLSSNLCQTLPDNHMVLKESSGSKESQRDGIDDHVASSSEYYIESETQIEMCQPAAPIYSGCDDVHDSSLTEPIKNKLPVDYVVTVSSEATAVELATKLYNNSRPDTVSSHTCNFSETGTPLGQSMELHARQVENLQVVEGNSQLAKLESEQIQYPDHKDEEIYLRTSFESYPEDIPSTSLTSKSSAPEADSTKQAMDPLHSFRPSFGLPPEVTPVNSEEMPPFPPLPPMQWRMGKFQLGPPSPQREVFGSSQLSLPIIPPFVADSKPQFSLPGSERGVSQLGDPFLPPTFAEEISQQNSPAKFGGNPEKPSILKSQCPSLTSDTYSQHNGTSLDGTQAPNQYLAPPASSNGNIKHDFLCLEDNIAQSIPSQLSSELLVENAIFRNDFVSIHGKPIQASNSLPLETSSNNNAPELISENSRECRRPLTPEKVEEQPLVIDHVPEAGTSESLYLFEQHSMSSSEEKTTWPSNAFALAPTFEVETTSGYRKSKLPRPRSPLIDAVVAHDRSTLRKVSERVRPQVQPKVDERDTLLEQIRTKSFNLKPAMVAGPSIQGPKTNLKLAAILEKANAIRQATAGSDEDEDTDSWSDS